MSCRTLPNNVERNIDMDIDMFKKRSALTVSDAWAAAAVAARRRPLRWRGSSGVPGGHFLLPPGHRERRRVASLIGCIYLYMYVSVYIYMYMYT